MAVCTIGHTQEKIDIKISAFKKVLVKLPDNFNITSLEPGMSSAYFTVTQKENNTLILEAIPGKNFPASNLLILCEEGVFNPNIILEHGTETYFYQLTNKHAILFDDNKTTNRKKDKVEETKFIPEQSSKKQASDQPIEYTFNPDYGDTTEMRIDLKHFKKFRTPLGKVSPDNVYAFVNNLLTTDNYIYVSISVENQSNQLYDINYVKFNRKEKIKRNVQSLESGPQLIQSTLVNNYKKKLSTGESTLLIYEFDRFTLDNKSSLNVVISESSGVRTMEIDIKGRKFNRYMNIYAK